MASRRLRTVGGSLALTVLGAATLASTLPRLALSSTMPACITESSGSAWLGIHLQLLSQSPACPEGSYAPGVGYAEIASFSIVLSVSALITGVITLLGAIGFGMAARHALHRARAWVHRRLRLPAFTAFRPTGARPPLATLVAVFLSQLWVSCQLLRGPPARVVA